jgi:hypothetical protein
VFDEALQRLVEGDERDAIIDAYTALNTYMSTVHIRARYDREIRITHAHLRQELGFATSDANKALGAAFAVASVVSGQPVPKFSSRLANFAIAQSAPESIREPHPRAATATVTPVFLVVSSCLKVAPPA